MHKKLNDILNLTKPLLYENIDIKYQYGSTGSCFLLRWKEKFYIVTAKHCYINSSINPDQTMYPIPNSELFLAISNQFNINENENYADQTILEVKKDILSDTKLKSLPIIDLSNPNSIIPFDSPNIKDIYLRGYPSNHANNIIYHEEDEKKIQQQAYLTYGLVKTRKSHEPYCFFLKMIQPTYNYIKENDNENGKQAIGMSGSPVYAIDSNNAIYFVGVIIGYNRLLAKLIFQPSYPYQN